MGQTGWIIIISYLVSGIVFALLCRSMTRQKGYENSSKYAMLGFFFNLLAFIYAAGLPDLKARAALAGHFQPLQNQMSMRPAAAGSAEDPGVIAAITAAISMIWDGGASAAGQDSEKSPQAVSTPAAGTSSQAGFVIRRVRRV